MPNSSNRFGHIVNNYFESLNNHNVTRCLHLLHENCLLSFTGAGTADGKEQIEKFLIGTLWKQFPSLSFIIRAYTESQANAAVEGLMRGTTAINKPFKDVGFMQMFDFLNEKIIRVAVYTDTPRMRAQVGRW